MASNKETVVAPNPVKQASQNALSVMSNSAFGSILGPVVDSQLLDVLGLGNSNQLAAYMAQIQAALQQIENQLAQLQQSVNTILAGITQIEEEIADVNVQALLIQFGNNAGTITEFFTTYSDALAALAAPATQQQAIQDLFNLLQLDNAMTIASAMTAIQQAFNPTLTEQQGLIRYQNAIVQQAITNAGSSYQGWSTPPDTADSVPITNNAGQIGAYDGYDLFVSSQNAALAALDGVVVDTFRAFVTVSMQGLILLNGAWLNSIYEFQITTQVDAINGVLAAMVSFGQQTAPVVDNQVAATLQTYGHPVSGPAVNLAWNYYYTGQEVSPCPFGADWIQWQPNIGGTPVPFTMPNSRANPLELHQQLRPAQFHQQHRVYMDGHQWSGAPGVTATHLSLRPEPQYDFERLHCASGGCERSLIAACMRRRAAGCVLDIRAPFRFCIHLAASLLRLCRPDGGSDARRPQSELRDLFDKFNDCSHEGCSDPRLAPPREFFGFATRSTGPSGHSLSKPG